MERNLKSTAPQQQRNWSLDLLRIFSCICIIMLHESGNLAWNSNYNMLIQSIVRPCLWVFVMLSGYFVLNKPIQNIKKFYLKNIVFLVIPLFVYGFFYQLYNNRAAVVDAPSFFHTISFKAILAGDIAGHFWFIYTLVGMYLAAPFLQIMLSHLNNRRLFWFLTLCFFFAAGIPVLKDFGLAIGFEFPLGSTFLFFFLLGYAMRRFPYERYKIPILVLAVINIPCTCFMALNPHFAGSIFNCSINMLISVVAYFVLFNQLKFQLPKWLEKINYFVSKRTYSIYLIHLLVLNFLSGIFTYTTANHFYMPVLKTALNFVLSFLLTLVVDYILVYPVQWLYSRVLKGLSAFLSKATRTFRTKKRG